MLPLAYLNNAVSSLHLKMTVLQQVTSSDDKYAMGPETENVCFEFKLFLVGQHTLHLIHMIIVKS